MLLECFLIRAQYCVSKSEFHALYRYILYSRYFPSLKTILQYQISQEGKLYVPDILLNSNEQHAKVLANSFIITFCKWSRRKGVEDLNLLNVIVS